MVQDDKEKRNKAGRLGSCAEARGKIEENHPVF
jgi:hypothetical protein